MSNVFAGPFVTAGLSQQGRAESLTNKFIPRGSVSGRVTRNSQQLNIPLCKTATGQRSFYYRIVSIRPELKLSQRVNSFKRNLKLDLLNSFLS